MTEIYRFRIYMKLENIPTNLHPTDPRFGAELGDIAISFDTCQKEAIESHIPFENHLSHLIIHAILHLLGYDHVEDEDAALMEGIEIAILEKMGIQNPYELSET